MLKNRSSDLRSRIARILSAWLALGTAFGLPWAVRAALHLQTMPEANRRKLAYSPARSTYVEPMSQTSRSLPRLRAKTKHRPALYLDESKSATAVLSRIGPVVASPHHSSRRRRFPYRPSCPRCTRCAIRPSHPHTSELAIASVDGAVFRAKRFEREPRSVRSRGRIEVSALRPRNEAKMPEPVALPVEGRIIALLYGRAQAHAR